MADRFEGVTLAANDGYLNGDQFFASTTTALVTNVTLSVNSSLIGNMSGIGDPLCEMPKIPPPVHEQIFIISAYGLVSVLAILGNALVCFIVIAFEKMRKTENVFIFNLALTDLLLACLCVPFTFVPNLIIGQYPFGYVMCKTMNLSQILSVLVSSYTLMAISLERYVGIFHPFRPKMTLRQVLIVVCSTWIISLLIALPHVIFSQIFSYPLPDGRVLLLCVEKWPGSENNEQAALTYSYMYGILLMVLQYFLPVAVMGLSYTKIAFFVWRTKTPGEALKERDKKMKDEKMRMTKMMVVVVLGYVLSWLPLNTYIVLSDQYADKFACYRYIHYVWFACHWLAMSHATYNPFIYFWMNSKFRAGFIYTLNFVFCFRRKSDQWLIDRKLIAGYSGQGLSKVCSEVFSNKMDYSPTRTSACPNGRQSKNTANGSANVKITAKKPLLNGSLKKSNNGHLDSAKKVAEETSALLSFSPEVSSVRSAIDMEMDRFLETEAATILLPDHPVSDV